MDRLMSYIFGIAIPYAFYIIIVKASHSVGLGAITSSLNKIGLGYGIHVGLSVLNFIAILSFNFIKTIYKIYYLTRIRKEIKKTDLYDSEKIRNKINSYFISNHLKQGLVQALFKNQLNE